MKLIKALGDSSRLPNLVRQEATGTGLPTEDTTASPLVSDMDLHVTHGTDSMEVFLSKAETTSSPPFTASLSHLHLPSFFLEPTWSKQKMMLSISNNSEGA